MFNGSVGMVITTMVVTWMMHSVGVTSALESAGGIGSLGAARSPGVFTGPLHVRDGDAVSPRVSDAPTREIVNFVYLGLCVVFVCGCVALCCLLAMEVLFVVLAVRGVAALDAASDLRVPTRRRHRKRT